MTTVRAVLAGWRVFLPVVLLTAVAQALRVRPAPVDLAGSADATREAQSLAQRARLVAYEQRSPR